MNQNENESKATKIAWISDFPIEWMADLPIPLAKLPKAHPTTWQTVLLSELEKTPKIELHIISLRKKIDRNVSFERNGVKFHVLRVSGPRAPSLFWIDTF